MNKRKFSCFADKRKSMRRQTQHRSVRRWISKCQVRSSDLLKKNIEFHWLIKQIIFSEVSLLRVKLSFWVKEHKITIIASINSQPRCRVVRESMSFMGGKPKLKRLLSLTQSEVIGLDDDEYIKVNVTQLKKKIFLFIGNGNGRYPMWPRIVFDT